MHEPLTAPAGPVAPQDRILTLDVLRAFALLGILVMNMPAFYSSFWDPRPPHERWPGGADRVAWWAMDTFFSGKFNSLFAFLFGVGFSLQLERLMARAAHPVGVYMRRLIVLLLIGVAHGVFLWIGDVLHMYALLGLLLVVLRRASDRTLLAIVVVGLLVPTFFSIHQLFTYTAANEQTDRGLFTYIGTLVNTAHSGGTYVDVVRSNIAQYRVIYTDIRGYLAFPSLFLTILLGFVFGRRGYLKDPVAHGRFWRHLLVTCLVVGLGSALTFSLGAPHLVPFKPGVLDVVVMTAYSLARPALMLFYASAIVLLVQSDRWGPRLAGLAPMGRMPLTNYLMQTLICTTIFNAYGLGLWNTVGPAGGFGLAVVIYVVQIFWSRWWFTRFAFGPMEWLWRALTYGGAPSMKRSPVEATQHEPA
ncbi:MAG TPA: DUF418 domain-containing protein [Luteitalea sp.]|nr:DUF418 domain-containing protein [Luteitalea sp.]